ncbi:hypothetical protein M569_03092, partial [Genlisea aurea]
MDSEFMIGNVNSSLLERKKRGRPRKYRPDGESSFSSMKQMASSSSSSSAGKCFMEMEKKMAARCGGGGVGNERKHKSEIGSENLGDWIDCSTGSSFLPHVITINSGEDVYAKIMEFARQGPRTVCIVSGRGSVMNVTLRHPNSSGGIVTYEGLFEIVSLSGSFTPGSKFFSRTGTLTVTASGADRRIVGGLIAGRTTAATPIKVFVTSFMLSCPKLRSKKECMVFVLDVGPKLHPVLSDVEKACSLLAQLKLIYNKYDEVGVVLFGTEDTKNDLALTVGGYQNVMVLQDMNVVDGELVELLQKLPRGTVHGDFVVGLDMLIQKYGPTFKGKKHLYLITDALSPIKVPYEGTKEEQVITIAEQMVVHGIRMDCFTLRLQQDFSSNNEVMEENDFLLSLFSTKFAMKHVFVKNAASLFSHLGKRRISPVTIYRGDFELSPVWVYKKTSEERFPTLKSYSDKAPESDKSATREIKIGYEYRCSKNPSTVVPPEQRIKSFQYGPQVVPISSAELDAMKFKPEKGVKLLGFTDASNIMRHHYMRDVNLFLADPGSVPAIKAISALARAMKEMNKVAIVRCVWRQGQASVVIGVLTPNLSGSDNIPDTFYFNVLPFAEDLREFHFPSFSSMPPSMQPNEKQQDAADKLVQMLDLAPEGEEEALQPVFTLNPVLQRFYATLDAKSRNPDAAIPPVEDTLRKTIEPDPELLSRSTAAIEEFRNAFEIKRNLELKKSSRSSSDEELETLSTDGIEYSSTKKEESIGDDDPVKDFEAMIRPPGDDPKRVKRAMRLMRNKIFDLVESSFEGDTFEKALQCAVSLRKCCISREQEAEEFDAFLKRLKEFCSENYLKSFVDYMEEHDFCTKIGASSD